MLHTFCVLNFYAGKYKNGRKNKNNKINYKHLEEKMQLYYCTT